MEICSKCNGTGEILVKNCGCQHCIRLIKVDPAYGKDFIVCPKCNGEKNVHWVDNIVKTEGEI